MFQIYPVSSRATPVKKYSHFLTQPANAVRPAFDRRRFGTATVEMALSLPLLITLVFGSMDMANAVFLRQSLNMAAYEAAKVITRPGDNEPLARTRCQQVLTARKVTTSTLAFSPTVTAATAKGTRVTVTLSAPASNLSYGPVSFLTGKTFTSTVVMVRL